MSIYPKDPQVQQKIPEASYAVYLPFLPLCSFKNRNLQVYSKIHMKTFRSQIRQEENQIRGLPLLDFQTYCKDTIIKRVWGGFRDKYMDQENRIEGP